MGWDVTRDDQLDEAGDIDRDTTECILSTNRTPRRLIVNITKTNSEYHQ